MCCASWSLVDYTYYMFYIEGILSEEFSDNSFMPGKSFITTPYVKFVETSGARTVPIL